MTDPIKICSVADLDNNQSIKFTIPSAQFSREAFLIRVDNQFYAYYNECPHVPISLDFDDNDFFSLNFETLVCKNHGAEFDPQSGRCSLGPCVGKSLQKIKVIQDKQDIYALLEEPIS